MKIESVGYFLEVAKYSSISRAARSLNVNRTTISMALSALEDDLNVELFHRQGNRLEITPAGTLILDHCQRIVSSYRMLKRQTEEGFGKVNQTLRLGRDDVLPESFWRVLLKQVTTHRPSIKIKMMYSSPENLIQLVRDGEIDVAYFVMEAGEDLNVADLEMQVIGRVKMAMMASLEHPLSRLALVENQDLALYPQITYLNSANQECFYLQGIGENRIALSSFELVRDGVLDNLGWGYVPMTLMNSGQLTRLNTLKHGMNRLYASFYSCRRSANLGGEGQMGGWLDEMVINQVIKTLEDVES